MPDWRDELAQLLGEITPDPIEPVLRGGAGLAGDVLGSGPVQGAFRVLSFPADVAKYGTGGAIGLINRGLGALPGQPGYEPGTEAAFAAGGPRAAWEEVRSSEPGWFQAPTELGIDPLTMAGIGGGYRPAIKALEEAANVATIGGRPGLAMLERGATLPLRGVQALNDIPGQVALPPLQAAFRGVKRGVSRVPGMSTAFATSARSQRAQLSSDLLNVAHSRSRLADLPGNAPTAPEPVVPRIGALADSPEPPVMPHMHPLGSGPMILADQMRDSWQRLWQDPRMFFTRAADEAPAWADRSDQGLVNMPPPWAEPDKVRLKTEHVEDMARIGAGVMQTVVDAGGIMPGVIRASEGMRQMREEIVGKYGRGIEPYLPYIYKKVRQEIATKPGFENIEMPSSRFTLSTGWAGGAGVKTDDLMRLNKAVKTGRVSREKALDTIVSKGTQRGSDPGKMGAATAAAAHGAAFLTTLPDAGDEIFKEFRPGGAYFQVTSPVGGARAIIPDAYEAFRRDLWTPNQTIGGGPLKLSRELADQGLAVIGVSQPFGTTRQYWDAYMRGIFGELADDDLNALAEHATDITYQAYVNAANDISGGAKGAAALAKAVVDEVDPVTGRVGMVNPRHRAFLEDGKVGSKYAKISARPANENEIGSEKGQEILRSLDQADRKQEVTEWYAPFTSGKPGTISTTAGAAPQMVIWGEQLNRLANLGHLPTADEVSAILGKTRKLNDKSIKDAIVKLGDTPLEMTNTLKGGMLPNLRQLMDIIIKGAPLDISPVSKDASQWYASTEREVERVVGTGNPEAASLLLDLAAITSAQTDVLTNGGETLRAAAEWMFGKDATLRNLFGITGQHFDAMRWSELLNADMIKTHTEGIRRTFDEYVARRESPTRFPRPIQEGYKTFDYASSFLGNIWRNAIDKANLGKEVREEFDKAFNVFTVDRHMSRVDFGPTDVSPIDYLVSRERGILASRAAGFSGEEGQAAGWYWARDQQGFLREIRPEADLAFSIQRKVAEAWDAGANGEAHWRDLIEQMKEHLGTDDEETALRAVYDANRQELWRRLLNTAWEKESVQKALKEKGLPTSWAEMQDRTFGMLTRGSVGIEPGAEIPVYFQPKMVDETGALSDDILGMTTTERELLRQKAVIQKELDATNTRAIYQRQVKKPVLEEYDRRSKEALAKKAGVDLSKEADDSWMDEVVAKSPPSFDPRLTLQENQLLAKTTKDGTTYRQHLDTFATEAKEDMVKLKEAGVTWGAFAPKNKRIEAAGGDKELEKIVRKWTDRGIDIAHADNPELVAAKQLDRVIDKESGVTHPGSTNYDLFKAAWYEQAVGSFKFHANNIQGAWFQNILGGYYTPAQDYASEVWHTFKALRGGADEISRAEAKASLHSEQIAKFWGLDGSPNEVMRGGLKAMTMTSDQYGPSAVGQLAGKVTRNAGLGRRLGWIFDLLNDLSLAGDSTARSALWGQAFDGTMWKSIPMWEQDVLSRARASGLTDLELNVREGINAPPSFEPDALKAHFLELGLPEGQAQRVMQNFVNLRGKALGYAKKEMDRVQFYGSRTNLDEWISKVIPFHYWYSRALRFYGEETLRHPYLFLNYLRASQGIDEAAKNDPGLSARQKGFLRLFGGPLGYSLLVNPDALFGVVKVFGMDTFERESDPNAKWSDPPTGLTPIGGAIDWMKQRGFGLYPWIDGMLNVMGLYGNTFEPDLLGIRHKTLLGAAVQFSRAHLGFDPAGTPYATAMGDLRYNVSSYLHDLMPWLTEPVTPRTGGSSQEASLDTMIESVITTNNPGITNEQLLSIMVDPHNPEYERAYQQVADAGLVQQLLNFTVPLQFRMRNDASDVRRAQVEVVQEEAEKLGVAPWEVAPTLEDVDFSAKYKAMTGKDWDPTEYADAKFKYDLIRAPVELKPFLIQENAYHQLGGPQARKLYDKYQAISNGTDPSTAGLPEGARREKAYQYLDSHRGAGAAVDAVRQLQAEFVASYPQFGEFKSWQNRMYDLKDQLGGSLAEYRRQAAEQNPNAARYFADQEKWIRDHHPEATVEEFVALLDQATSNASAWQAITGKGAYRSAPGPIPGVPPTDVTLPNMLPPEAGGNWQGTRLSGLIGQGGFIRRG